MRFVTEAPIRVTGLGTAELAARSAMFIVAWSAIALFGASLPTLSLAAVLTAASIGGAVRKLSPRPTLPAPSSIAADERGVTVDGALALRRAEVTSAYIVREDLTRFAVHLEGLPLLRRGVVYLTSEREGRELLAALDLEPSTARAHFTGVPSWAGRLSSLLVLGIVASLIIGSIAELLDVRSIPVLGALALAAVAAVTAAIHFVPKVSPLRIEVGHDGISLRWWANRSFIAFKDIRHVTRTGTGVEIMLRSGERREIDLVHDPRASTGEGDALHSCIVEGMSAGQALPPAEYEMMLAQGARTRQEWELAMRRLAVTETAGGYRDVSIPRHVLWSILENAASDASAREGAALALGVALDASERARMERLSRRTASSHMRAVLQSFVGQEHEEAHAHRGLRISNERPNVDDVIVVELDVNLDLEPDHDNLDDDDDDEDRVVA